MERITLQSIKAQIALLRNRFFKTGNESTQEKSELEKTVEMYVQYFSNEETKEELKNEGVTVSLGLPFRLYPPQTDEQESVVYTINKFGIPVGDDVDQEEKITSITQVKYDKNQQLQSIVFASETGAAVETHQDESLNWVTTQLPAVNVALPAQSTVNTPSLTDQLFFSLRDIYHSYIPVLPDMNDLMGNLEQIEKFKTARYTQPRAALFPVRKQEGIK